MPAEIALHGVVIPALCAVAIVIVARVAARWCAPNSRGPGGTTAASPGVSASLLAWFDARAVAVAVAVAFALSYRARQGWTVPPRSAWEWLAPLVVACAVFGALLPRPRPRAIRLGVAVAAALIAGGAAAWSLALIDLAAPSWRAAIGGMTAGIALVLVAANLSWPAPPEHSLAPGFKARVAHALARSSGVLIMAISIGGLALVVVAAGFEKLATISAAVAATLTLITALAIFIRPPTLGLGGTLATSAMLVGGAAVAAAYLDSIPRWHWLVAVAAPLPALAAVRLHADASTPGAWRIMPALLGASLIALGNAGVAIGPLIARGEFPPP